MRRVRRYMTLDELAAWLNERGITTNIVNTPLGDAVVASLVMAGCLGVRLPNGRLKPFPRNAPRA